MLLTAFAPLRSKACLRSTTVGADLTTLQGHSLFKCHVPTGRHAMSYAGTGGLDFSSQHSPHSSASQAPAPETIGQNSTAAPQLSQMQQLQLLAAANANLGNLPDGSFSSGLQGPGGLETSLWNCELPNSGGFSGGISNADMMQLQANLLQQHADLERGRFDLTANLQNLAALGFVNQLQGSAFGGGLGTAGLGNDVPNLGDGLDGLNLGNLGLGNQQALNNAALAARLNMLQNGFGGNLSGFGGDLTGGQGPAGLLNGLNPALLQNNRNNLPLQQQLQLRELQNLSNYGQTPQLQVDSVFTSIVFLPGRCPCLSCKYLQYCVTQIAGQTAGHLCTNA